MRHHKHPGLAGSFDPATREISAHPDAADADRLHQVWIPLPDADGRTLDAVEGLACVPTREGAVRVVAVPHLASDLALGDELAVGAWEGDLLARGPLASSLHGTLRIVGSAEGDWTWQALAAQLDPIIRAACAGADDQPWYDVIAETALAVSVPRVALGDVFAWLHAADPETLRWEYATAMRHPH
jgi:hypothetical protein